MATHDYDIANQSGSAFRTDLNNALQAIVSVNSSSTAPATTFAYQYWIDTSASPALLKQRNGANDAWITKAQIGGQLYVEDGTLAAPGLAFKDDVNTGLRRSATDRIQFISGGSLRLEMDAAYLSFYANGGGANSYRFHKDGSPNYGLLSFESISTVRTYTFPDVSGTIALSTSTVASATDATNADNVQVDDDTTTNANRFIAFADGGGGTDRRIKVDGGLTYNPSTNIVAAGGFSGPLTGNVTGNVTGDVTGNVTGDLTSTGEVIAASISFDNGTTSLDEYEIGSFTPTYTTGFGTISPTYDQQEGRYIRVGDICHFVLRLRTDELGIGNGSGDVSVSGLPFTSLINVNQPVSIYSANWVNGKNPHMAAVMPSNTKIALWHLNSTIGNSPVRVQDDDLGTTANDNQVYISGTYRVA